MWTRVQHPTYRLAAGLEGIHIHALSLEQCEQAVRYIEDFQAFRPPRSAGILASLQSASKLESAPKRGLRSGIAQEQMFIVRPMTT